MKKWQLKVFALCWAAYASAYLCRTNLSIALPDMMESFRWSKTSVGLIGSAFFWAYAIGQLINGYIGDKVQTRKFIFFGLGTASLINIVVGFSSNLWLVIILWAANGFLLSTLWGPIVKTISVWFSSSQRNNVAIGMSMSMIGGYLLSWGLVGIIVAFTSWSWAFWIPGIITLSFSILWVLKMRNHPSEVGLEAPDPVCVNSKETAAENTEAPSLVKIIVESQLYLVAIACIAQGVIKDGITLWTPSFLQDSFQLGQQSVAVFSLIVPLVSILGIVLAGWLNKLFKENEKVPIMFLLFFTSLFCILLFYFSGKNMYIDILLLSLSSALMYGANTLLLTIIPLKFSRYNKVSGIAGFLDFCSYLGAGFSGFLTGSIVDGAGWKYMMLLWAILAILGIGSMALLHTCKRPKAPGESPAQLIIEACKKNKSNV